MAVQGPWLSLHIPNYKYLHVRKSMSSAADTKMRWKCKACARCQVFSAAEPKLNLLRTLGNERRYHVENMHAM